MFLKRLELQGYKTFASRTEIEFDAGITAVVGPNGSGKSNIADAIRWVLGEGRPTNLRIKRTEDLIFAGSHQRPRQGMAEVAITLDNSSGWLPIEFSEVTITRRVFRSGETEHRLNGSRVRSRDIADLLAKGGITRDSYVVIGQGLVDAALSLRPTERRTLFEAAAGISYFQSQKEDSLAQLEETRANVLRVRDIMAEIEPRLARLEKQAQRAEEHRILNRDLRALLQLHYGYQWQSTWTRLQDAQASLAELTEFAAHDQARLDALRAALAELGNEMAAVRIQLSGWHEGVARLHTDAEGIRRELAVGEERDRLLVSHRDEIAAEIAALLPRRQEAAKSIAAAEETLDALTQAYALVQAEQQEVQAAWRAEEEARSGLARQIKSTQESELALARRIAQAESRLLDLAERREDAQAEIERLGAQISAAQAELSQLAASYAENLRAESAERDRLETLAAARAELDQAVDRIAAELASIAKERADHQHELDSLRSRQRMLERIRGELSGYYSGVRAVIQAADQGELSGVHGPLVRLLGIRPDLDTAISVALGAHLQDIVVETWRDAEAAIALLKRTRSGRATFMPLDTVRSTASPRLPSGPGIIGVASELVEFDARYRTVVELLLNRTLVVDDLDTAHRLLKDLPGSLRLVTLEGELILANGSLSGGAAKEVDSKIALERDWREMPRLLAGQQGHIERLSALAGELDRQRRELATQLDALQADQAGVTARLGAIQRARADLERRQATIRDAIALRERDQLRRQADLAAQDRREVETRAALAADQAAMEAIASEQARLAGRMSAFDGSTLREEAAQAEAQVQLARRNRESQAQIIAQQRGALARLDDEIKAKRVRSAELEASLGELAAALADLLESAALYGRRIEGLRQQIEPAEARLGTLQAEERALQADVEGAQEACRVCEGRLREADLSCRLLGEELERLQGRITEEIGPIAFPRPGQAQMPRQLLIDFGYEQITLDASAEPPADLEAEIHELRGRLRRLGVINPDAPAEYDQEMGRYSFLAAQVDDLEQAIASLQGVIQELDQVMERQFSATFSAVATEFAASFQALFGGGSARLTLTNPEDMNQTGIDIVARPPGKRLQSLALLSGGERALTAAALLFALLKANPLPFCVLDEVDAMLDEANVGRFRDSLVAMAGQTQFIVITHNRNTVEAARSVYGITMRRDGVSAALSLRLDGDDATEM